MGRRSNAKNFPAQEWLRREVKRGSCGLLKALLGRCLALAELEALASTRTTCLLTLLHAGVAGQQTLLTES